MGHIPYPTPQQASSYEKRVTEGDIVRIEHPEQMDEEPPEEIVGKPLEVTTIDNTNSELTVKFDGEEFTIPLANAKRSTRTPPEIVGALIDYFK